jgi:heat shock protein HslJ
MKQGIRLVTLTTGVLALTLLMAAACAPVTSTPPAPAATPIGQPAAMAAPGSTITGIVWQWMSGTNQSTRQTTNVPDPQNYTIIFNADGTTTGKADCNTFTGTWSQQNGFHIQVTPSAMSACGTLDSQYLTLLKQVAAGGPDGAGNLALETAGGEQRMLFKNGGPAPTPA